MEATSCDLQTFIQHEGNAIGESDLKHKIMLILLLAVSAGILSVMTSGIPTGHAAGGSVYGVVLWTDQYGNVRPMAWAQVTADDGAQPPVTAYTTNGSYGMWLPEGMYDITASSSPGFYPATVSGVVVSSGSSTALDFTLQPTGEPIPELPPWAQPLILLCAIVITAVTVRRHKNRSRG